MSNNNRFPALEKEMEKKKTIHVPLKYVDETEAKVIEEKIEKEQEETKEVEKKEINIDPFRIAGFDPDVVDFVRRCDTDEQALEIIDFMEKKGDLANEEAKKIRIQLAKEGLRSFGKKKEKDHYFKTL
ncbi:MAG: DUF2095 family protein [Candidatus Heimdallarchaeota archaeon]